MTDAADWEDETDNLPAADAERGVNVGSVSQEQPEAVDGLAAAIAEIEEGANAESMPSAELETVDGFEAAIADAEGVNHIDGADAEAGNEGPRGRSW